jgi:hypothetical protein
METWLGQSGMQLNSPFSRERATPRVYAQGSPSSNERATLRGMQRALMRHRWGQHGRSSVSHPTCDIPFPLRRTGIYWKGMISARPSCQGSRDRFGSRNLRPRAEAHPTGRAVSKERLFDWY